MPRAAVKQVGVLAIVLTQPLVVGKYQGAATVTVVDNRGIDGVRATMTPLLGFLKEEALI
jgi:hypothetical protein